MDEAKIDISRATRFFDLVVKIAVVLSFVLFLLSFYIFRFKSGAFYKNQVAVCDAVLSQGVQDNTKAGNPIQNLFMNAKSDCFERATRTTDVWGKIAFIAIDITILLPIVYFGGKKLVSDTTKKIVKKETFMQSSAS